MLKLDHLTVIAPTLKEGVSHVRACLDLDVPFGQRHGYMGTHNHLLQLGGSVYLEIVAADPEAERPIRPRWFNLDNPQAVRRDWDAGRRLRGWVGNADPIDTVLIGREGIFGTRVSLPWSDPSFDFAIPDDGTLPLDGAAPSVIGRRGKPRSMANMADLGARLLSFAIEHPNAGAISELYHVLDIDHPPIVRLGATLRYSASIATPTGTRGLF
jgi:Glyoxalase-like domain